MELPFTTRRRFLQLSSALAVSPSSLWAAVPDSDFVKAMQAVRAAVPLAEADPDRPIYHFHPPANWNNDPNGTIFYQGWHHLFYQFNPYGSEWGNMHWGHARSRDLVSWEHLPIALCPSEGQGERQVYSGGAILANDGRPRLIYTSIGDRPPQQWMATPTDNELMGWEKYPANPVLTLAGHGTENLSEWRDPFLFRDADATYMVCGGNTDGDAWGGGAAVQLYRAKKPDLTKWKYLGHLFQDRDREIYNIECPNLFPLDGKWVLIVSPQRPCEYWVGNLDLEQARFIPQTHGILDAGDAYASNISLDNQGRTILWLWGKTDTPPGKGWNGVMVMPRILSVGPHGFLQQRPPAEFQSLRGEMVSVPATPLHDNPVALPRIQGDAFEMEAVFRPGKSSEFGIEVRRSAAGKAGATIAVRDGTLKVGAAGTYIGHHELYTLRLFLDKRCLEVYVNDGLAAMYRIVNANQDDLGIAVYSKAGADSARLESINFWPMKPAHFSQRHFSPT